MSTIASSLLALAGSGGMFAGWLPLDTWTVVVGALAAMSCALLGTFLVLRRMSLMGDAISHAVLPGLATAFLLTGSRSAMVMFAGAAVVGVLTTALTEWVRSTGKVEHGASMGVVFTSLFALGLVLIRQSADHVDLDPDCVLYGAIEMIALDQVTLLADTAWAFDVPRAALTLGGVFLLNGLAVLLLYKELKLSSFDPELATTLGFHSGFMHYLLMALVAVTTVAAFESVGSILVIAMLIVPPATAYLLTDRLSIMILLSLVLAGGSAALGHISAIHAPAWVGFGPVSTSTAGMMSVVAGLLFVVAMLAAPRHGILSILLSRLRLSIRIVREDILGLLYRLHEIGADSERLSKLRELRNAVQAGSLSTWLALLRLYQQGQVAREASRLVLTSAGRQAAASLVRSHRLWETYLEQYLRLSPAHVHASAERLEHVTGPALQNRLSESLGHPPQDPHGSRIPG